jgi:hypothetical protein
MMGMRGQPVAPGRTEAAAVNMLRAAVDHLNLVAGPGLN